jgi:hypothetical protein
MPSQPSQPSQPDIDEQPSQPDMDEHESIPEINEPPEIKDSLPEMHLQKENIVSAKPIEEVFKPNNGSSITFL